MRLLESIKFVMFLPVTVTQFTKSLYALFSSSAVQTLWDAMLFMRNSMAASCNCFLGADHFHTPSFIFILFLFSD